MIYMLRSHTQGEGFIAAICERRSLQGLTSSLADSRGDRQTPGYTSVFADGRCVDLTQPNLTHMLTVFSMCVMLHRCTVHTV